jgi:hypothetical protein
MWRDGIRRIWERTKTVMRKDGKPYSWGKFPSADAMFDWWLTGQAYEPEPPCLFEEMMGGSVGIPNRSINEQQESE